MNLPDILVWSFLLLPLAAAVVLALLANRRTAPKKRGLSWLIFPVVVVVAITIGFAALGGWDTAPNSGFQVAAIALLILIGVIGGSPLVLIVLKLAGSGEVPIGAHGGILVGETQSRKQEREILRGGMTIGFLERLAIIGGALVGQYAAVAIVIAIKGLGRFSELESAEARERFIIGTLVSINWAAACAAPAVIAWG
ncbi:MAG: hypothetical protein KF772_09155 [Cryobacterium sp.]|nr:hypothetical protein [Cryobacterium sp.]MBX3116178.1 hypothetical protein [Cryobacterium sp.]